MILLYNLYPFLKNDNRLGTDLENVSRGKAKGKVKGWAEGKIRLIINK